MLYIIEPAPVPITTTTTHGKTGSKNKNKRVKTDWNALLSSAAEATTVVAVKDTLLQPVTSVTTATTTVSSVVSKLGRRKALETSAAEVEKEEGEEEE